MNSNRITKVLTGIFGGIFSLCFVFLFIDIIIIGFDENVDRRLDSFSKMFVLLILAVLTVGICELYFHYASDKSCQKIKTKSRFEFMGNKVKIPV